MQTRFISLDISAKKASISIAFKHISAVLAAYAVVIAYLFFVVAVHIKLEYGQLAVILLLLPLIMETEDSFIHNAG
jgi:hypothetical protein